MKKNIKCCGRDRWLTPVENSRSVIIVSRERRVINCEKVLNWKNVKSKKKLSLKIYSYSQIWGESGQFLGEFLPRNTQWPSIMMTKLERVAIPRWSVPIFRKSQFSRSARKCPDQNPAQLRMIYTIILPIPPPRTRWKMAPYKVAIRPPKISVGKVIGSQFTRWELVCQRRWLIPIQFTFEE